MTTRGQRRGRWPVLAGLTAALFIAACGSTSPPNQATDISWTLSPSPPIAGDAVLSLTVQQSGAPVQHATLTLEGHMTHLGMAPVLAKAREDAPGRYSIPFTFSMAGDWVLLVNGVLADGSRVEKRIDVPGVKPAP